jgi:hypothetical protein
MKIELPAMYTELNAVQKRMVRDYYADQQNGMCLFCDSALNAQPPAEIKKLKINWKLFPPGFTRYPVHLQHDHTTGLTEGAVHSYCNAVMWQYYQR